MNRRLLITVSLAIVASVGIAAVLFRSGLLPPADSRPETMHDQSGMESHKGPAQRVPSEATHEMPDMEMAGDGSEVGGEQKQPGPAGIVTIPQERLQTIGVRYEPVARRPLQEVIRTVGRVTVDERRLAKVTIKFHGWIERLFVSATGDRVKKGQELFTIYSPDLVATQEEYLLALQARKQLGESEFPEVARSSQELLEATRHRLHLWDITEDHIRDLEWNKQVTKTLPIHSPITGTVIRKEVLQGTHVEPGEELYTIADLSHVWVLADVYEYELSFVKIGQEAAVSLSYDPGTILNGRVGFVYPTLDPKTRTAKVRFELDNPDEMLKPDMYANVELRVNLGTRLAIPQEAIIESGRKQVIFVHHGGGRLEPRLVKTGVRTGEWSEVLQGLNEGDHVVTSANFLIDSESRLKSAVDSMGGMPGMK